MNKVYIAICFISFISFSNIQNSFCQSDIQKEDLLDSIINKASLNESKIFYKSDTNIWYTNLIRDTLYIKSIDKVSVFIHNCIIDTLIIEGNIKMTHIKECLIKKVDFKSDNQYPNLHIKNSYIEKIELIGRKKDYSISVYDSYIQNAQFGRAFMDERIGRSQLNIERTSFDKLQSSLRLKSLWIKHVEVDTFIMLNSIIKGKVYSLDQLDIKYLIILYCSIYQELDFDGYINRIEISDSKISGGIDLSRCKKRTNKYHGLILENDSLINFIDINPKVYRVYVRSYGKERKDKILSSINLNKKLLKKYKEDDLTDETMYVDIHLKLLNHAYTKTTWIYYLEKWWWYFGYKKHRVPINTIIIFLFFSLINSFCLKGLNKKVYLIEEVNIFLENHKTIKNLSRLKRMKQNFRLFSASLFYTGLVFFGLKITLKNLKFAELLSVGKIRYMLYFGLMYFLGLFCVAFLIKNYFSF